jgi:hypothetical protein
MNVKFEIKYLATREQAQGLLERARHHLQPDPHCPHPEAYRVTSLYYDTARLTRARETIDGLPERRKFRLRRYGEPSSPTFFEVKSRLLRSIFKQRIPMTKADADRALRDPLGALPKSLHGHARELARERHLPGVTVYYDRLAYQDMLGGDLRITLDSNVRCARAEGFTREMHPDDPRIVPPGLWVLELKFRSRLPRWLAHAIQDFDLTSRNHSKYIGGVRRFVNGAPLIQELAYHG